MNRLPLLAASTALGALCLGFISTPSWSQPESKAFINVRPTRMPSDSGGLLYRIASDQFAANTASYPWCRHDAFASILYPAGEGQKGKEIFDSYGSAVGTVNPAAGALFKGTGVFLDLDGYFGKAADPVGDAIKRINERLDAIEARMAAAVNHRAVTNDEIEGSALAMNAAREECQNEESRYHPDILRVTGL